MFKTSLLLLNFCLCVYMDINKVQRWQKTPLLPVLLILKVCHFSIRSFIIKIRKENYFIWGQISTLKIDPQRFSYWKLTHFGVTFQRSDRVIFKQISVEKWPGGSFFNGGLFIQRGIMTRGHNSTLSYDPGSQFNEELWPWVKISRWIMTRVIVPNWIVIQFQGHNWTLNHVSGSQFNVELRPGVIIQRGIKTRGHNSTGVQILSVEGSLYNDPLSRGVAIQHEKTVESWSQPVELRPLGWKFNGVKIQSYTGLWLADIFSSSLRKLQNEFNKTWQEARSQHPLPMGWSEKQEGRPGRSVKKVTQCSQVHDLWPFGPVVLIFW